LSHPRKVRDLPHIGRQSRDVTIIADSYMTKSRMEAFSDGVVAIIITVMVLEMRAPHGTDLASLRPLIPVLLSYVLSFVFLGIYWSNHHHLLQAVSHVNGGVLWANLHLLFWLSLTPFVTNWMGENQFAAWPVALYGTVLLFAAVAYFILVRALLSLHGRESTLATALGRDFKGKVSMVIYAIAIPLAFVKSWLACAFYVLVAIMWLVPDRRIEKTLPRI
jgi:TMEM175 potassium channel family protein